MARPVPTSIVHFTHVSNLASIVEAGLVCDTEAAGTLLRTDVGSQPVKRLRREQSVPVPPGGTVADYVPFYFAPRSPMMYAIHRGRVPEYSEGLDPLVYLSTTVEELDRRGINMVFTDGNAANSYTTFGTGIGELDDLVDWPLMRQRQWANTDDDTDRRRRRMAECLAVGPVPWEVFGEIAVRTDDRAREVRDELSRFGVSLSVRVRTAWYF